MCNPADGENQREACCKNPGIIFSEASDRKREEGKKAYLIDLSKANR